MQERLSGIPASPGIVVGTVHRLRWEVPQVPPRVISEEGKEAEIARFHEALEGARERLRTVRARAEQQAGKEEAGIFDAQLLFLDDPEIIGQSEALINQNLAAERAFELVMLEWRQMLSRSTNPMMRERINDITDVMIRVLTLLLGLPDHDPVDVPKGSNAILVTHDLTPSLTVQLDREAIAAIATDAGTRTAHVAILARSLRLPAVVGLRDATQRLIGGELAILDGDAGTLLVNPTPEEIEEYRQHEERELARTAELQRIAIGEPVTSDGVRLTLRANVDLPDEAMRAARSGAHGVGLMRTEFLVVGRTNMPDENEQYRAYRGVVEAFAGEPVIVRTFDIGGDKLPVGGHPAEPNPFLGWRAIRMCLDEPELFSTQLRAMLRAAVHGDLRMLLPLVNTVEEVWRTRELLECAVADLTSAGVPHRTDVPLGVMIETPAAALLADSFAGEVAFFSIGTNDLVQYTLAVDRGNVNLAPRYTPLHPGVLRLIKGVVEVGASHDIDVGVCGEMASQPLTAFALIGLGVRQLSVSPRAVPLVKRMIFDISAEAAREAVEEAMKARTAARAHEVLARRFEELVREDPLMRDGLPGTI